MGEYIVGCDLEEAIQSLWELDIICMWHEVVKRAIVLCLDGGDEQKARVSALLATLSAYGLVTLEQMKLGFERTFAEYDEILLDVPDAARMLALMLARARAN